MNAASSHQQLDQAETLVAMLRDKRIAKSVIGDAHAYLAHHAEGDFVQWLAAYAGLGDYFQSGGETAQQRADFADACRRLDPQPTSIEEWSYVVAWALRLFESATVPAQEPARTGQAPPGRKGRTSDKSKRSKPSQQSALKGEDVLAFMQKKSSKKR